MKNYNISHDLICSIKGLYSNATSAVFNNGSIGEWFQASVGVRQGCLLSPTLFNIFLERIMTDALDGHAGTVSIGGRPLTNLRFADDILRSLRAGSQVFALLMLFLCVILHTMSSGKNLQLL